MSFALFSFLAIHVGACRTTDGTDDVNGVDAQIASAEAGENGEAENEDDAIVEDEGMEEGFCKDDVYSTYIRDRYMSDNRGSSKKQLSAKERNSLEKKLDMDAMFFARSRMIGPMNEFYGTLPVIANPRVEYWMRYFKTNGRQQFLKWLVRAESVKEVVNPLLRQEGLPQEIFFLGMIESGFSNNAYSRARATGPWQFMRATAQLYGLKVSHWVDERKDPIKSTIAAARYLKDMYIRFGDWYLAMASYNAGPGKISRAIRKSGSRDFWQIAQTSYLKAETKHYVPKVLAAAILASNPVAHGFEVKPDPQDRPPTGQVLLKRPVKIDELARKLDIPVKLINQWNPELLRNITPPMNSLTGEAYPLRLPAEMMERYNEVSQDLAFLEIKDVTLHQIRHGDTLISIAHQYGVSADQIKKYNPEINSRALKIGKLLAVPIPSFTAH